MGSSTNPNSSICRGVETNAIVNVSSNTPPGGVAEMFRRSVLERFGE